MTVLFFLASASAFGAAAEGTQPSVLPPVSFEAILDRNVSSVRNVQWFDTKHLVGDFIERESRRSIAQPISMSGKLGAPAGEGSLSSLSPDTASLLQHTPNGWVVRDLSTGEMIWIEEPSDERRSFSACCPPVWSLDGRYAAFVEGYRPKRSPVPPEIMTIGGVPIIDVSRQAKVTENWVSRITIFDRAEPAEPQRVFVDDMALGMGWGPDHSLFVTQIQMFGNDASTAVLRLQPGSWKIHEVFRTPGRFQSMAPAVHPNGTMIALVLDADNRVWSDFESVILIDANSGKELRRLTRDLPVLESDYVWSIQGDEIYVRVRHGGYDQIYAIPLVGKPRRLTQSVRRHWNMQLSPDGRLLSYQTMDGYGRHDIRTLDIGTGKEKVVLVLDEPASKFKLGEWQHVRWDSTDGVRPFGHLIMPPDYDPDLEYPMIVYVHGGGPGSSLSFGGPFTVRVAPGPLEWHAWSALGYIVFIPDYRSTGEYGPEVIAARYRSGQIAAIKDIEDVVSGTRYIINRGMVDSSRVAIFGNSAGGARVYVLLTLHDLYSAAILNEAIPPDPVSRFIGATSGEYTGAYGASVPRQIYGGELSEVPDRYKANYMLDSYRNKTPTLIMVGNEALGGVDHMPNEVLYSILKQHGTPSRLLKFVAEGHSYSRPESAQLAFDEARHWLDRYMIDRKEIRDRQR